MSRSGYVDDYDDNWSLIRWRGYVASAIRGKRGQAFLREMLAAMDAMPIKRLTPNRLEAKDMVSFSHWGMIECDSVCAIGSVGKARRIDMKHLDPDDYISVAATFGINEKLVQEVVYMNDEAWHWETDEKGYIKKDADGRDIRLTPEGRFQKMRAWIASNIAPEKAPESAT